MSATTPTAIDVADLYDRPGVSRRVRLTLDPAVMPPVPLVSDVSPVRVMLLLESLVDGILARGVVQTQATLSCARCLQDMPAPLSGDVVELFADPRRAADADDIEEGYEIIDVASHPLIDLDILVRDALTEGVPMRPLCREDCAGLCATCGTDLNAGTCHCVEEGGDNRWAALRSLHLPEGPPVAEGPPMEDHTD